MDPSVHVEGGAAPGCHVPNRRGERGALLHKAGALVVVLLLAAAAAAQQGLIPPIGGERQTRAEPEAEPQPEPLPPAAPGLALEPPAAAGAVLKAATSAKPVAVPPLKRLLRQTVRDPSLGRHLGLVVSELGDEQPLWTFGEPGTVIPASTLKLLTTLAALEVLGPREQFETTVVSGRSARDVVLVGGGDPLLTGSTPRGAEAAHLYPRPASLEALAVLTAARLEKQGVRRARVRYDDSLFVGPAVNPQWEPDYVPESVVSPISALWVDEGRVVEGLVQRVADPADEAAQRFVRLLKQQGVIVLGAAAPGRAPKAGERIAMVESAPLDQIVQHVLEASDNEGAEVLLRHIALAAGRPGSSGAGVQAMRTVLTGLGIDLEGAKIYDGSGLSRQDVVPTTTLVDALQIAAQPAHPELRTVISTLPVAGFNGSLADRFVEEGAVGVGVVRAKTGTLTGVHGLAGLVMTREGQPLLFAAVADRVPVRKTLDARATLDVIAAQLSTCGC
ncbi:MAG: D-alanyl-D-alanine carboxypeptidase/D-alanyl-D-alanine-endopeptidase [Nocardioidaceae bacterium]|nr:D-alanyl-D-alanine carboxypeptidase/D-alanyl-D-alanine-endopeptidase [Nocardioidaceae bacterium]